MRVRTVATFSAVLLGATAAHADPGLSSLGGLIPLYVAAFLVFLLLFYFLPIRLAFRAKKLQSQGTLSGKRLLLLLFPAGLVGALGLIDFAVPINPFSEFFSLLGPAGPFFYWIFAGLSGFMVFFVWSTYQQWKDVPTKPDSSSP